MLGAFARKDKGINNDLEAAFELFPILEERRAQPAGTFSGGEQQMLAMGRAMMSRPKLLMLDEPSMGLSPLMMKRIMTTVTTLQEQGTTILLVEQNAQAALKRATKGYVLEVGKIVLSGTGQELSPATTCARPTSARTDRAPPRPCVRAGPASRKGRRRLRGRNSRSSRVAWPSSRAVGDGGPRRGRWRLVAVLPAAVRSGGRARRPVARERRVVVRAVRASTGARKRPVCESSSVATCSGVPSATTRPPPLPPSGPRSTIQSALLMTSRLCSMTITVLPLSTRPWSTPSSLRMSSKCRPVVGSSST